MKTITVGDLVVVDKGQSIRVGTVAFVKDIRDKVVYLSSNEKTSLSNIRLVKL